MDIVILTVVLFRPHGTWLQIVDLNTPPLCQTRTLNKAKLRRVRQALLLISLAAPPSCPTMSCCPSAPWMLLCSPRITVAAGTIETRWGNTPCPWILKMEAHTTRIMVWSKSGRMFNCSFWRSSAVSIAGSHDTQTKTWYSICILCAFDCVKNGSHGLCDEHEEFCPRLNCPSSKPKREKKTTKQRHTSPGEHHCCLRGLFQLLPINILGCSQCTQATVGTVTTPSWYCSDYIKCFLRLLLWGSMAALSSCICVSGSRPQCARS